MSVAVPKPSTPPRRWLTHDTGYAQHCRGCHATHGTPTGPYPLDVAVHHQNMLQAQSHRAGEGQ